LIFKDLFRDTAEVSEFMSSRLLLIRHGESETRYKGRYIGKTDAGLSENGEKQGKALAAPLAAFGDASFFCSPLGRARRTAELAAGLGVVIKSDKNLREIDFGLWEGLSFAEISAAYPAEVVKWAALGKDFTFPEGESTENFRKRVEKATVRMINDPAETAVVFTHGGVIRFLICHFLGLPDRNHLSFGIAPASITEIALYEAGDRPNGHDGVLLRLNDRHHLGEELLYG
jgi:alpha-ribazole phosphatase